MPELDRVHARMLIAAYHRSYRRSNLYPFRISARRKYTRIGRAFRRYLPGSVLIAVQVIDVNLIERFQIAFTHPRMREAIQPRIIRDEADHTLACRLHD